jgi:hypothetical protein
LEPRIDVTAEMDWREIGDAKRGIPGLQVNFETDTAEEKAHVRYEAPFEAFCVPFTMAKRFRACATPMSAACLPTPRATSRTVSLCFKTASTVIPGISIRCASA